MKKKQVYDIWVEGSLVKFGVCVVFNQPWRKFSLRRNGPTPPLYPTTFSVYKDYCNKAKKKWLHFITNYDSVRWLHNRYKAEYDILKNCFTKLTNMQQWVKDQVNQWTLIVNDLSNI